MGDRTIAELLEEALALPSQERARVASALLESIEPDADHEAAGGTEWETAWSAEIERRLRDFDEGRTAAISHDEFVRRIRARLTTKIT